MELVLTVLWIIVDIFVLLTLASTGILMADGDETVTWWMLSQRV
jgi:hypothetical protein